MTHNKFPSGRNINRCKQDAKTLVKKSKNTDTPIKLATALDIVAKENGIDKPWNEALDMLRMEASNG